MNMLNGAVVDRDALIMDEAWTRYNKAVFAEVGERDGVTLTWWKRTFPMRTSTGTHEETSCSPVAVTFDSSVRVATAIRTLQELEFATNNGFDSKDITEDGHGNVTVTLPFS